MIEKLVAELEKQSNAYDHIAELYGFLLQLKVIDEIEVKKLVETYSTDLDDNLLFELEQFIPLIRNQTTGAFSSRSQDEEKEKDLSLNPLMILNWIDKMDIVDLFSNVYIALQYQ
ncbi:hypothetical protein WA026_019691 [Henosepilachna vigintioctopunctata]|uniref:Uncharacterized protein n=1 Tax=Henosepilachna vigintioctopunctata TaxID=420089 RepID=A0AAW1UF09_9CUCU